MTMTDERIQEVKRYWTEHTLKSAMKVCYQNGASQRQLARLFDTTVYNVRKTVGAPV